MQDRAAETAYRLREEFGPLVIAKPVGLDTFRGLWLSLKHRLRNDLHVVINARRVVLGSADYEVLRKAIDEEASAPAAVA
jgi:hypothetical protein